jgi:thymidylate synthase
MHQFETQYIDLVKLCLRSPERAIRNGGARSFFGHQLKVSLLEGFPLLVGRKMFYRGVFGELAAMLRGPKHIDDFKAWGCNYWEKWANADGSISVDYGNAWLDYNGVNQLEALRQALSTNPTDRRMVITSWRPDNLANLSLPCCHYAYQFYVTNDKVLHMAWIQRSVDVMIGLPSDIVFAAAWLIAIANEFGFVPGTITLQLGDCHVYNEHIDGAKQYVRQAEDRSLELGSEVPTYCTSLSMSRGKKFELFEPSDIVIENYKPEAAISFLLKE